MATPQATQPQQASTDESVRITADIRRRVLVEHYTEKLARQREVAQSERMDRKALGFPGEAVYTTADLRVSNAVAVLQDISATLSALGENRDFR